MNNQPRQSRSENRSNSMKIMNKSIRKSSNSQSQSSVDSPRASEDRPKRCVKVWSPWEDYLLNQSYITCNGQWKQIVTMIPGRNISQCSQRWKRINPNTNKLRNQWSLEEDKLVIKFVGQYGKDWRKFEAEFPIRNGKQIRERWINKLDPDINHSPFTPEEDIKIERLHSQYGRKWSQISKYMDGRPVIIIHSQSPQQENMVKNRFYTYIKKNQKTENEFDQSYQLATIESVTEGSDSLNSLKIENPIIIENPISINNSLGIIHQQIGINCSFGINSNSLEGMENENGKFSINSQIQFPQNLKCVSLEETDLRPLYNRNLFNQNIDMRECYSIPMPTLNFNINQSWQSLNYEINQMSLEPN